MGRDAQDEGLTDGGGQPESRDHDQPPGDSSTTAGTVGRGILLLSAVGESVLWIWATGLEGEPDMTTSKTIFGLWIAIAFLVPAGLLMCANSPGRERSTFIVLGFVILCAHLVPCCIARPGL